VTDGPAADVDPEVMRLASELRLAVGLLLRRLRHAGVAEGELTMPEASALAQLDRGGPATAATLAKREQISPQSMSVTVAALSRRGLVARAADPGDGRRILLTLTPAGAEAMQERRSARTERLARALASELDPAQRRALTDAVALLTRVADAV
jgi:DNA-binding MarR family transcriptional regulator